ncbi:5089_t:CDS:2 [Cetraspora pellucida]|uniref:5089_t:CDS:1 n=1 Tax=Cetraspora pellucida TaxID=1433469 RepID=A0A9N8VNP0_9GLOM|nr:5089_t:CDS:2 [Cetraspora pellucida]
MFEPSPRSSQTVDPRLYEKYHRRVTKKFAQIEHERTYSPKAKLFKILRLFSYGAVATYAVLYADFGEKNHCFTSIRAWYAQKKNDFWTLSEKEVQDLKEQGKM